MKRIKFQLYAGFGGFPRGEMIRASGGTVYVATAGDAAKATLFNADGSSLANPVSLTNGGAEIYVANTVSSVDLYIMAPGGQFVVKTGVVPGADSDIGVDITNRNQVAVIPFAIGDTTAAVETDTGFNEPANALFHSDGAGVRVSTADATETIDVGTDSGDSGDANGFLALADVGTAALVSAGAVVTAGGTESYLSACTLGALLADFLAGADVAGDVGTLNKKQHVSTSKSITYTLTAGSDTAEGFILLPYTLMA